MQSRKLPPRQAYGLVRAAVVLVWMALVGVIGWAQAAGVLTGPLSRSTDAVFDGRGNLYFSETNRQVVRRLDPLGGLTTVAGSGVQGFVGDGGAAVAAQLDSPAGLALDTAGNLYIADTHNHRVRRVSAATGVIVTAAGSGVAGFSGDGGAALAARLDRPSGVAVDAAGNVYIADSGNHRIRRVKAADGTIATVAGNGVQGFAGDGGPAVAASINAPGGIAVDATGTLYLSDTENDRVRVVDGATGLISTVAGALARPHGVAVDAAGTVFVADTNHQRVGRVANGVVETVAGDGVQAFRGDGGPAVAASFDTPRGVTLSGGGMVTIADTGNRRLRQVAVDRTVLTLLGAGALGMPDFTLVATGAIQQTVVAGGAASFPFSVQMEGGVLASPIALAAGGSAGGWRCRLG